MLIGTRHLASSSNFHWRYKKHRQMAEFTSNAAVILCCQCGIEISPNAVNLCASCLRSAVDITEGINKELTIHSCRSCARFLLPPWSSVQLESKELLAACLRKIPGLSKVKLIDAVWIWTEPHSLRLKVPLLACLCSHDFHSLIIHFRLN